MLLEEKSDAVLSIDEPVSYNNDQRDKVGNGKNNNEDNKLLIGCILSQIYRRKPNTLNLTTNLW